MNDLAESTDTGLIAHTRLQKGAEPATLAEAARLLLTACSGAGLTSSPSLGGLPPGVLAFVAVAAHANGDEEEEARHTQALLDLARVAGEGQVKAAGNVLTWTHPNKAAEMARSYLLGHPRDHEAYMIWMQAWSRAEALAARERLGPDEPDALASLGDPSDPGFAEALSERALRAFKADPQAKAMHQAHTEIATEIMRRQMMPPWQVERLRRAEAGK